MKVLRSDENGQFLLLKAIPYVVLLVLLVVAALQFSSGCLGTGLFLVGIASIVFGLGGSLKFGFGLLVKVSGTAGFVLLVAGAVFYAFISHC